MKRVDWNALADTSLHGRTLGQLVRLWATRASEGQCDQCHVFGACEHNAARVLLGLIRLVEHPDDCPECKAIEEQKVPRRPSIDDTGMHKAIRAKCDEDDD